MLLAVDFGGTNTDILLARPDGAVERTVMLPWAEAGDADALAAMLTLAGVPLDGLTAVAVTGGRHRMLPEAFRGVPLHHVDELTAIGRGALLASGRDRALVVSMGTGTAFISADAGRFRHLGGTAVGGGTVPGLARLTLGTADPVRIGALAADGNPARVDLSVGDIVGGAVGVVPPTMTAAHFGRVGRPGIEDAPSPEDVAAGLMELVGQVVGRLGLLAARANGHDTVVLTGRLTEWPGIHRAITGVARAFGGRIIVPPDAGTATARGALAALLDT